MDKYKLLLSEADTGESQIEAKLYGAARIPYNLELEHVVIHELGHAVGIDHHGDSDIIHAYVITDGPCPPDRSVPLEIQLANEKCPGGSQEKPTLQESDLTRGKHVCEFYLIARMHGLHSGNAQCPMKYEHYLSHESPTHPLENVGSATILCGKNENGKNIRLGSIPLFAGQVYPYRNDLDPPGMGHFAADDKGTGVNGLPGEKNHAGDACRPSSAGQIRVKDWGSDRPAWIKCEGIYD